MKFIRVESANQLIGKNKLLLNQIGKSKLLQNQIGENKLVNLKRGMNKIEKTRSIMILFFIARENYKYYKRKEIIIESLLILWYYLRARIKKLELKEFN